MFEGNLLSSTAPLELSGFSMAITEHSPWPMATVSGASHTIRNANPAFCRLLGKDKSELQGSRFEDVIPEGQCLALLDRVLRTGKPESHTQEEHSSPDLVFWSYTMWPVMQGEIPIGVMIHVTETARFHATAVELNKALVLGVVRQHELVDAAEDLNKKLRAEIQERLWVEDALRASEARFRMLFQLEPVAIFSCDRKGIIQTYNQRAAELWGRAPQCGTSGEHFSVSLKFQNSEGPMPEVLRGGMVVSEEEIFIETPSGTRIAAAVACAPLKDHHGEIVGAIMALYDISARRQLEESLAARAADLEQADRSKDEFLAMLAHELRNPLAPLRNAAEILSSAGAGAQAREGAQRILSRQIENMSRMVDDLLDVARITEGKIELRRATVQLDTILAAAVNLTQPGLESRRQELTVALPSEPIFLDADATRLEQVFGNLLANSSKYSDSGTHICVTAERIPVTECAPAEVAVRVRDDGIGIAPELLPRIFDLFVQATSGLDRGYGGLGIGLTLVQRLVKLHGGSVEARSPGLGHGSEFIVRLPIFPGPVPAPKAACAAPVRDTPLRMLIVDDNEDSAQSMAMLQRLRGHETLVALTGPAAIAMAADFAPEVVLLDIGLPGMDGFEVARQLRAMPSLADTLLVAMTGYGTPGDRANARAAGIDEYLLKPVDLDLLREWMRER
jgi:PAS domain S-box-containing protein